MSNSDLVAYTKLSPNYSARNHKIDKITIHHCAAVNATLTSLGYIFSKESRQASSNYGIDSTGKVGMFVEEKNRAWTSSNRSNDMRAITIEVANSNGAPNWEVSNAAMAGLIELCVDICKRNDIKQLTYTGDANGNLTTHDMFAATNCPGPFLKGKMNYIASEVNKQLNVEEKCKVEVNVLKKGAKGNAVKTLQILLNGYGFACGSIDGSFGSKTDAAVRAYQKAKGLAIDGSVGAKTWNALING